jgi:hypothetical protein
MVFNPFNVLLNYACKSFIKDFCVYVHEGNWSIVFSFGVSSSVLGMKVILTFQNQFGSVSPFPTSGSSWMTIGVLL